MRHGSLFSGIGGFELGAKRAGLENVFACEIEKYCRGVLRDNYLKLIIHKDIRKLDGNQYRNKIDIISAGFPCQDISISNSKGKGLGGKKSELFFEGIRVISRIKPRWFILENVARFTIRGLDRALTEIAKIGYNAWWGTLSAEQFGYPHRRERVFIVAHSDGERLIRFTEKLTEFIRVSVETNGVYKRWEDKEGISGKEVKLLRSLFEIAVDRNYKPVPNDDGIPKGLPKEEIKALGNAVIPDIPEAIFKVIKEVENQYKVEMK